MGKDASTERRGYTGWALVASGGDAGFGLGDGAIDELNGAAAMTTLVVLSALQRGAGGAQMLKRSSHVGLVGPSGLKTKAGNQENENNTCA